jgi:chorismate mutase/prephenate dehydratase
VTRAGAAQEDLRRQIDEIDVRLVELLDRRARSAMAVGKSKRRNGRAVYAPDREHLIYRKLPQLSRGPLRAENLQAIYREIMSSCLALEQPLRISYLGPAGTYSEQAAREQFGASAELQPFGSVDGVFEEVERRRVEYGVVPVENSTEGVVAQTLDRFVSSPLTIKAEISLRIDHCLLARRAKSRTLRRIVSHPQSLAQCRGWLAQHYPGVPLEEVASNAAAAELAARQATTAAIAGRPAAERYRLRIVAESIQDQPNNFTRFVVICGDGNAAPTGDDKTSILFSVPHQAGALFSVLQPFARHRINLSTIESRPLKGRPWEYVFFLDLAGHINEAAMAKAIAAFERRVLFLRVLGSYPAFRWPDRKEALHGR